MPKSVTLHLPTFALTGVIDYNADTNMLQLVDSSGDSEVLSIDIHGLLPVPGHVLVRDYSEHSGLPSALEAADVAEIVQHHAVGPYAAPVVEMRVL